MFPRQFDLWPLQMIASYVGQRENGLAEKAFVSSSEENLSSEMITRLAWVVNVEDVFGPHTRTHAFARTQSSGWANIDVTAFNRRPRPARINDTGHQGRQRFLVFALQAL